MRTARTTLTALLLFGALSLPASAQLPAPGLPQAATFAAIGVGLGIHGRVGAVGVDFFYSNLAPYGYWIDRPSYGWVWVPRHVRHGWRPYSSGRWVYTDYGWTWVSSEPYGWATYHYGRWYNDPDYGYEWVPGTDWGPAWVSWQQGGGYLGWAALPPDVGWNAGAGLAYGGVDLSIGLAPHYCFVPERNFLAANVGTFIVPPERNLAIIRNTTNFTNYTVEGGRVFNRGVAVDRIQQVTGQPVRQFRLAAASDPRTVRVSGNSVAMFRPTAVVRRANAPDPTRVAPRAVATGRVAEQLRQERHSMAAQAQAQVHQQGGARGAPAQAQRQSVAGRQQSQVRGQAVQQRQQSQARGQASPQRQQYQSRRQAAPAQQRQQYQAQSRRQAVQQRQPYQSPRRAAPPPQRQQSLSRHQSAPQQGAQQYQSPRRAAPPPQRQQYQSRGQMAPQRQAQQVQRRSAPPPQNQRQSAAPQQARRQSAPPPQRQPQAVQRQAPPPQRQAQAPPPQRQARAQAQPQRPQRRQPPPPSGGPSSR
jgi:hypothetical protein